MCFKKLFGKKEQKNVSIWAFLIAGGVIARTLEKTFNIHKGWVTLLTSSTLLISWLISGKHFVGASTGLSILWLVISGLLGREFYLSLVEAAD